MASGDLVIWRSGDLAIGTSPAFYRWKQSPQITKKSAPANHVLSFGHMKLGGQKWKICI